MVNTLILARRVRAVRISMYGEGGLAEFARLVGVPERTWRNYESGVVIPAQVMLRFLVLTGVDPNWLLSGEGDEHPDPAGNPRAVKGRGSRSSREAGC
jgi:hypothetical protein